MKIKAWGTDREKGVILFLSGLSAIAVIFIFKTYLSPACGSNLNSILLPFTLIINILGIVLVLIGIYYIVKELFLKKKKGKRKSRKKTKRRRRKKA